MNASSVVVTATVFCRMQRILSLYDMSMFSRNIEDFGTASAGINMSYFGRVQAP